MGLSSVWGALNPLGVFADMYNKYVGNQSYWDNSVDAIRKGCNEMVNSGPESDKLQRLLGGGCTDYLVTYSGSGCTSAEDVVLVLNCYTNMAIKGDIAPLYYTGRNAYDSNAKRQVLADTVSKCSGVQYDRVFLILTMMHDLWAASPSTVHISILDPKAWQAQKENRATSEQNDSILGWFGRAATSVGGGIEMALDFAKWMLIVVGAVAVGFGVYFIIEETR